MFGNMKIFRTGGTMEDTSLEEKKILENILNKGNTMVDHSAESALMLGRTSIEGKNEHSPEKMGKCNENFHVQDRWLKTSCALVSLVSLGMCRSVFGPAMLDLETLLNVDTKTLASSYTTQSFGFFTSAIVLGLLYDNFNPEFQFLIGSAILAGSTMLLPSTENLAGFIVFLFLNGFGYGYVDIGVNPYILSNVWKGHQLSDPFLQAAHALFMLGAAVGPLIMEPFLSDNIDMNYNIFNSSDMMFNQTTYSSLGGTFTVTYTINGTDASYGNDNSDVQLGFIVIGILCIPSAVLYLLTYLRGNRKLHLGKKRNRNNGNIELHKQNKQKIILLVFLCLLFALYLLLETSFGSFLAIYVVKGLHWVKYKGSIITTVLWAATFAGRVIAIPVSAVVSPGLVIIIDLCLITSACVLFLLGTFISLPEVLTWAAAGLVGLGFSSFFATCFLWTALYVNVDGKISAALLISGSVGRISSPFLVGFLFQLYSPHCFVYVMFATSVIITLTFISAMLFVKISGIKRIAKKQEETKMMQLPKEDKCEQG